MPGEVKTLQAKYEQYISLTASRQTAIRYAKALEQFFSRFRDMTDPSEFTRVDIEDYKILRLRSGVNPRTVNYEVQIVRAFWNWMMQCDLVKWNPASTVKRLKTKEPERKSLTLDQQEHLYESTATS